MGVARDLDLDSVPPVPLGHWVTSCDHCNSLRSSPGGSHCLYRSSLKTSGPPSLLWFPCLRLPETGFQFNARDEVPENFKKF